MFFLWRRTLARLRGASASPSAEAPAPGAAHSPASRWCPPWQQPDKASRPNRRKTLYIYIYIYIYNIFTYIKDLPLELALAQGGDVRCMGRLVLQALQLPLGSAGPRPEAHHILLQCNLPLYYICFNASLERFFRTPATHQYEHCKIF